MEHDHASDSTAPPGATPLYGQAELAPPPAAREPVGRPSGRPPWLAAAAAGVAIMALLLVGLPGGSQDGGALTPIAEAAQRTGDAAGARFSGTGTATSAGLEMTMHMEGVFNGETERSRVEMRVETPAAPQVASLMNPFVGVQDGLTMYLSSPALSVGLPDGRTWMKLDMSEFAGEVSDTASAGTVDARSVLAQLELVSGDAREVGHEKVRGARTTHYAATLDPALQAEQLRAMGNDLAAEVIESDGGPSSVDVWIDRRGLVRRTAMAMPFELVGGPGSSMSMTMDFYDFGITPKIDVPSDDDAYDATDMSTKLLEEALGQS